MNENLPVHVATSLSEVGTISYANEVIAIIAGMAAAEIDGVAAMGATSSSISDILNLGRKSVTRGVKVEVGSEETSVDLVLTVEYGKPIQKVCQDVQESVRRSIEMMTGLHVVKVDVHVQGVSFEREAQELAEGSQHAKMDLSEVYAAKPNVDLEDEDEILEVEEPEDEPFGDDDETLEDPQESEDANG